MIRQSGHLIWLLLAPFFHHGNRWTRKTVRRHEAAFWLARSRIDHARFRVLSGFFQRRRSFGESITTTVVAWEIAKAIVLPVLLAAVFVILLTWFDHSLFPSLLDYLANTGHTILPKSIVASVEQTLGGWLRAIAPGQTADGAHGALLVTGAQVTGAFLGLYFTAISVVAGTAYDDVPPDLRSVLIEDRIGSVYLKVVGFTGSACLFALGMLALGYSLGTGSALAFAVLGVASVLSFVTLGKRVFTFLDPEAVTRQLSNDIATAVNATAATGFLAKDRSIQSHHQRTAARKIDAWEELVTVSIGRSQSASALKVIGAKAVSLLHRYSEAKFSIPKTSQWFERMFVHPSYLLAGGRQLTIASRVGWMDPKMEPDHLWLEKRIGEIIQRVVMALLEKGNSRSCVEILDSFDGWIARSANQFRVREMEMGLQIASRIGSAIRWKSAEMQEGTDRDRLYGLAVLDNLVQSVPNAAGSLNQRLSSLPLEQLLQHASKAAFDESRPLEVFSPKLRAVVESLRKAHLFEKDVEGSVQTPSWFVQHHLARLLSEDVRTTFESLLNGAERWLPSQARQLGRDGPIEGSIAVIGRGLESVFKLEASAEMVVNTLEKLKRHRAEVVGEEWPNVNSEEWQKRLRKLRLTFIEELVELVPRLPTTPPKGDLPDSFGFAYTTLCNATFDALGEMDTATFELVYPVLLPNTLAAHDRVRSELIESPVENALALSVDIILDVIEISGYAYLWKFALGKEGFWDCVTSVWDVLLSGHQNPERLINIIALGADFHQGQFSISPRSTIRQQWRQRATHILRDKGFAPRGFLSDAVPTVIAIDPVASSYIQEKDIHDARDLMLSEYILKRPEAQGIQAPRSVVNIRRGASRVSDNRQAGRVEGR